MIEGSVIDLMVKIKRECTCRKSSARDSAENNKGNGD